MTSEDEVKAEAEVKIEVRSRYGMSRFIFMQTFTNLAWKMYGYTKMLTSDVEVEVKAEAEVKRQGQIKVKDI